MRKFVDQRSGSPAPAILNITGNGEPSGRPTREQIAANAKVSLTRTKKHTKRNSRHGGPFSQERTVQRDPQKNKGDRYDTDAESIGVTTISEVQVEDSQVDSQGIPYAQRYTLEAAHATHEDGRAGPDEVRQVEHPLGETVEHPEPYFQSHEAFQQHHDMFSGDQSYPTTTSGRPESRGDADSQASNVDSDDAFMSQYGGLYAGHETLFPKPTLPPVYKRPEPTLRRPMGPPPVPPKAAAVQQVRPENDAPARQPPPIAAQQRPQPAILAPRPMEHKPVLDIFQKQAAQGSRFDAAPAHQGPRHGKLPVINTAQRLGKPLSPVSRNPFIPPARQPHGPFPQEQHVATAQEETVPLETYEDYDRHTLYSKSYRDLQQESFDYDPNPPASIFPEDMTDADLHAQLEYARRELGKADQMAFLASLPFDAWEEAGDWLVEQIGDVMKEFVAARREKRRLAAGIEKAVHSRMERVEMKRECIDGALRAMKSSGVEVLTSPAKRKGMGKH